MTAHRRINTIVFSLLTAIVLSACQTEPPPPTATPTPLPPTATPTKVPFKAVGSDINVALPEGDPEKGLIAAGKRGCTACHGPGIGPAWLPSDEMPGIGERAQTIFTQDDYTGNATSPEQYLFESIVQPSAYIVEPFSDNVMIDQSGILMSAQEMADVIAYLLSLQ
jgi:hypothetical protein